MNLEDLEDEQLEKLAEESLSSYNVLLSDLKQV